MKGKRRERERGGDLVGRRDGDVRMKGGGCWFWHTIPQVTACIYTRRSGAAQVRRGIIKRDKQRHLAFIVFRPRSSYCVRGSQNRQAPLPHRAGQCGFFTYGLVLPRERCRLLLPLPHGARPSVQEMTRHLTRRPRPSASTAVVEGAMRQLLAIINMLPD